MLYCCLLTCAVSLSLEPRPHIIIPSTFAPNENKKFQLNVWSDEEFQLVELAGKESEEGDEEESDDDDHGEVRRARMAAGDEMSAQSSEEDEEEVSGGRLEREKLVVC